MSAFSGLLKRMYWTAFCVVFLFVAGDGQGSSQSAHESEGPKAQTRVRMVVCTDHERYSLSDSVRLNALLENAGDERVYVDRRMFWTGLSGGLKLVIEDGGERSSRSTI